MTENPSETSHIFNYRYGLFLFFKNLLLKSGKSGHIINS